MESVSLLLLNWKRGVEVDSNSFTIDVSKSESMANGFHCTSSGADGILVPDGT